MPHIEIIRCPACDESHGILLAALDAERKQRFVEFDLLKYGGLIADWIDTCPPEIMGCSVCGHCWYRYQPKPEQIDLMYASGKHLKSDATVSRAPAKSMLEEMKRLRKLIDKPSPSLLDYGSGYGRWARAGVLAGLEVCAFEPSKARGGEDGPPFALVHDLESLCGKVFDIVNLEQVLEHVPDPLSLLEGIRRLCHPGSVVRITVPNILRSEESMRIWRDWPFDGRRVHVMAPFEHLHGFTPVSLAKLCARAKFQPIPMYLLARSHPSNILRRWIGAVCPSLGTTAQYLAPCS